MSILVAVLFASLMAQGCWWIEEEEDQDSCDAARDRVCGCGSIDCGKDKPAIVTTLETCDPDEFRDAPGFDLTICIRDSSDYCRVQNGLAARDPQLCDVRCTQETACDLEGACHDFQRTACDLSGGGGAGGGS